MNHVSLHACTMGDGNETMFVAMKLHESTWRDPATDHQTKANTSTMPEEHSGDQSTNTNKIHMEAVTITCGTLLVRNKNPITGSKTISGPLLRLIVRCHKCSSQTGAVQKYLQKETEKMVLKSKEPSVHFLMQEI